MRIISGTAKGKRLTAFSGTAIRPTPDKVRGAIFSMLYSRLGSLTGAKVLDLFAGTGAMAIEALSRGAAHAWLVDAGDAAAKVIEANLRGCGMAERATFLRDQAKVALLSLAREKPFDLIFVDPPYGKNLLPELLEIIGRDQYLTPDGIICAEGGKADELPQEIGSLVRVEERAYGITRVHLYRYQEPED